MPQLTLVFLYGPKPQAITNLIQTIWHQIVHSPLAAYFTPYELEQVHSTLIGLERLSDPQNFYVANIWQKYQRKEPFKWVGLEETLAEQLPITIQLGGFSASYDQFTSLGKRPYYRSFQMNWKTGKVVLMGWPVLQRPLQPVNSLIDCRDRLYTNHNILHKYSQDNDCYWVLGTLDKWDDLSPQQQTELQKAAIQLERSIRATLAAAPSYIRLDLANLRVVQYEDTSLPLATSKSWSFATLKKNHLSIRDLYL